MLWTRLKELFSNMRPWVFSGAIGGILFYTLAQLPLERLVANVYFSVLLAVAVAVLLALALMSAFVLTKLGRVAWKQGFFHRGLFLLGLVSLLSTLAVYAIITGWKPIRSLFGLPYENLLVASGVIGCTYIFLFAVIFVCKADFKNAGMKMRGAMTAKARQPKRKKLVESAATQTDSPKVWDANATPNELMSSEDSKVDFDKFANSFNDN
jgi:hypothetical protein